MSTDADSPWKETLEYHLRAVLEFFFPEIAGDIDWSEHPVSREQEFRKVHPEAATGKRIVDRIFQVKLHSGDTVFLHIEIQGGSEPDFPYRIAVYNYRATDYLGAEVISVALIVGDEASWHPEPHVVHRWGFRKEVRYLVRRTVDWRDREEELEKSDNLFALFLLIHLRGQATREDEKEREREKLRLLLKATEKTMDLADVRWWQRLFDWLMPLPPDAQKRVETALYRHLGGEEMPFVSMFEKWAMERGLLKGVMALLTFRFGDAGAALQPRLEQAEGSTLEAVLAAAEVGKPLEEIEGLLPPVAPEE